MKLTNLAIYTIASSVMNLAWGFIGPFYYLYLNQIGGGIEEFGIALGVMTFGSALVAILAGKYSDLLGRKPFLIGVSFLFAVVVSLYTFINSIIQLYILQAIFGVLIAIEEIVHPAFLGDITKKSKRGFQLGLYRFIVNISAGVSIIIGGFLINKVGFEIIFYLGSVLIFVGALFLFKLKETVRRRH